MNNCIYIHVGTRAAVKALQALRDSCDIFTQPKDHKCKNIFDYMLFNFVFPVSLISQAAANKSND